jgi:S-adenosyl-L-methionine hydrolase (adenosine-forming)
MSKKSLITITTDLGDQFASAQLLAVTTNLGYDGQVISNHGVTPFCVTEGAFEIAATASFCPIGTVHLGIVDPGVGSSRRGTIIKTKSFWLVGPDNGLLYPAASKNSIEKVWQIHESKISQNISNTFHGRDVFIKAAVFLAKGLKPEEFGCISIPTESLKTLEYENGQVLHIDHYGNVKIYVKKLASQEELLRIKNLKVPFVKTFSDVPEGQPLAYIGSHSTLELAINLGNAAKQYNITVNDTLSIGYV